jgi:hypothetical protein
LTSSPPQQPSCTTRTSLGGLLPRPPSSASVKL